MARPWQLTGSAGRRLPSPLSNMTTNPITIDPDRDRNHRRRGARALGPGRRDLRPPQGPRPLRRSRAPRGAACSSGCCPSAPSGCSTSEPAPASSRSCSPSSATPPWASTTRPRCWRPVPARRNARPRHRVRARPRDADQRRRFGRPRGAAGRALRRRREQARAVDDGTARGRDPRVARRHRSGWRGDRDRRNLVRRLDAPPSRRARRPDAAPAHRRRSRARQRPSTRATAARRSRSWARAHPNPRTTRFSAPACTMCERVPRRDRRGRTARDVVRRPPRQPVAALPRRRNVVACRRSTLQAS